MNTLILPVSFQEIKSVIHRMKQSMETDPSEAEKVFQAFYDEKVEAFLAKLDQNELTTEETKHRQLVGTRKNGKLRKKICFFDGIRTCFLTLQLQRIRSDQEHWCIAIYLSIMIPGRCQLLLDVAQILQGHASEYKHTDYTPGIVSRIRTQWRSIWKPVLETPGKTREDFLELALLCIQKIHRQIFQRKGFAQIASA